MPAVLVHGHPETAAVWRPLIERLERTDVIALSLPGYASPRPDGFTATCDAYADWLIGELEAIGEPVDLVGHDWGGAFTVRVACLRPDLVRTWTSDAVGLFDADHVWHDFAKLWQTPEVGEQAVEATLGLSEDDTVAAWSGVDMPEAYVRTLHRAWDRTMWDCALALYRSAVGIGARWGSSVGEAARRPGMAVVPDDPYIDRASTERAAGRAGARIERLPGLGHWWLLSDPDRAAALLSGFWSSA